jgi:predicted Zn finger-like uncharacterized protein
VLCAADLYVPGQWVMLVAACPACQARYRVPNAAAGKRTTCKRCGESFRIAAAAESTRPRVELTDLEALADGSAVEQAHLPRIRSADPSGLGQASVALLPDGASMSLADAEAQPTVGTGYRAYLAELVRSLFFFRRPAAILTFAMLWLLLALREVMQTASSLVPVYLVSGLIAMAAFVISGWYMAFQAKLVVSAAGAERDLPGLSMDEGMWDGVVVPFYRMFAAGVFALLPAGIFLCSLIARMTAAAAANPSALLAGASPMPGTSAVVVLTILALVGLFFWPMMVLIVSCGESVVALFQLDLIVATVLKSFPAYLLTVLAVYASFGVRVAVIASVWAHTDQTKNPLDDWANVLLLPALFAGISLFFDIVAMRAIGYYYCCFKHKFAWSWE